MKTVQTLSCLAPLVLALSGCANSRAEFQERPPLFGRVACSLDISSIAAAAAKRADPNPSGPAIRREGRNDFIAARLFEFFDQNHDGLLDFDEYTNAEWAGYLAELPEGVCVVTKDEFLKRFLGDPKEPENVLWKIPYKVKEFSDLFENLDKQKKRYLIKEDFLQRWRGAFDGMDRNHDHKLSPRELGR